MTTANAPTVDHPYYVKALLHENAKWEGGASGTSLTLTYSFATQVPDYYAADEFGHNNFIAFNAEQIQGAKQALALWEQVTNITFVEVADTGGGQIQFGTAKLPDSMSAYAYYPLQDQKSGDIWLNNGYSINLIQTPGSFGFKTMLHEIGHALGLKHPGDYDGSGSSAPYLPGEEDNSQYTVMAYDAHPAYVSTEAQSPLLYDIAAIQALYGANMTTRTGDDLYQWDTDENFIETIWDAGGIDTISAENQNQNAVIDLNAGNFSSIGANDGENAVSNVAIAFGVTIENAMGGTGNDLILGNDINNRLEGNTGSDVLFANNGDDWLDGGSGKDELFGGSGNDTYITDSLDDTIVELADEGIDTVLSSSTYLLSHQLENLTLTGTTTVDGTGNSLNNTIQGNAANNNLIGLDGQDFLIGGAGIDTLQGGSDDDRYQIDDTEDIIIEQANEGIDHVTASISYVLSEQVENLSLTGNATSGTGNHGNNSITGNSADNQLFGQEGEDELIGGEGNDQLDGGSGHDAMRGGVGDDHYTVDSTADTITEYIDEGHDTVSSLASYTLGDNLEDLILAGSSAINGTGNSLNNRITGNIADNYLYGGDGIDQAWGLAGNDYLFGQAGDDYLLGEAGKDWLVGDLGNDTLAGGAGKDRLIGGLGNDRIMGDKGKDRLTGGADADQFVFTTPKGGLDVITDFRSLQGDRLVISITGFNAPLKPGKLAAKSFTVGSRATTAETYFIYNPSTKILFFDPDGTGRQKQMKLAQFSNGAMLTNKDIFIESTMVIQPVVSVI